ncbi:porin [Bosea thiooxidans]
MRHAGPQGGGGGFWEARQPPPGGGGGPRIQRRGQQRAPPPPRRVRAPHFCPPAAPGGGPAFFCLAGLPARAAGRPPQFLRSCTIEPPDQAPLFRAPASSKPDAATASDETGKESDDDDDGGDDDDEEDDDETPRGFVSPGSSTCISVSGTVNAGLQRDDFRANAMARATGLVPPNTTSFPLSSSFRIETGQSLADGGYLASAFEFSIDTNSEGGNDVTIDEASVTLGAFVFGLAGSRFDFWAGDEFAFVDRIPSRTVALVGYERQLTETTSLSLSVEDVSADRLTALPAAGRRVPDGVVRLLYESGGLTVHGAVAVREVPRLGASSLVGRAAILGATWEGKLLARPVTLTAQIAGAVNAPPYIGSRLDQRTAFPLLGGDMTTRGWSSVVAIGREWTDEWSTNAYVSRYQLSLPQLAGATGKIEIDRLAANVVWAPVDGLRLGLEASLARQRVDIAGNTRAASLNGRQSSAQLFIERSF